MVYLFCHPYPNVKSDYLDYFQSSFSIFRIWPQARHFFFSDIEKSFVCLVVICTIHMLLTCQEVAHGDLARHCTLPWCMVKPDGRLALALTCVCAYVFVLCRIALPAAPWMSAAVMPVAASSAAPLPPP